jgi:hypothetical protein
MMPRPRKPIRTNGSEADAEDEAEGDFEGATDDAAEDAADFVIFLVFI